MATTDRVIAEDAIRVLDHGFVRLDDAMATDLSVVNAARVSFARHKDEMDAADEGLIRFLMRDRHGTPFEHNSFRFHVRTPIFVAREWFRHRVGCLTGDNVVTFVDTNGHAHYKKTLDELWAMWSVGERNGHALAADAGREVERLAAGGASTRFIARNLGIGRRGVRSHLNGVNGLRDARWRVRKMRLRVLDESTGEFTTGHIADIFDKGVQPVYELTLADGKRLTLTENHQVLTDQGWKTMAEGVGLSGRGDGASMSRRCALLVNGRPVHRDRDWLSARREAGLSVQEIAHAAGCSYDTIRKWLGCHGLQFTAAEQYRTRRPWNAGKSGYATRLVHSPEPRVHQLYDYTCQSCRRRGGRLHAHHILPVWLDRSRARDMGNLISVCDECHRQIHRTRDSELGFANSSAGRLGFATEGTVDRTRGWRLTAHPVAVVAVRYLGLRQTYDLAVEGEWHNFVANGVVVHNSFNEFSMRYAKATDDFYVPEAEDVRSQVGKPGAYSFEPVAPELAERTREELRDVYEHAFETYERLVEAGVARELARAVMPVGAYTEFFWTVNARALMNFVSLRAAETAQREIRRYADAVEQFFAQKMPVTHAAFVAANRTAP